MVATFLPFSQMMNIKTTKTVETLESVIAGDLVEFLANGNVHPVQEYTFGNALAFTSSLYSNANIDICPLDSTHAVIAWGEDGYLKAVVVTESAMGLTAGSTKTLVSLGASTRPTEIHIDKVGTNKFCVVYKDASDSSYPNAIAGTVSGTTITSGTKARIVATATSPIGIVGLEADKAITIAANTIYILTFSGTTITVNTGVAFGATIETVTGKTKQIGKIDNTKVVVAYSTSAGAYAKVVTISGTTPTPETGHQWRVSTESLISSIMIVSPTSAVVFDGANSTDGNCYIQAIIIDGNNITSDGTPITFASTPSTQYELVPLGGARGVYIGSTVGGSSTNAFGKEFTIDGSTITLDSDSIDIATDWGVYESGTSTSSYELSYALLRGTTFIIIYRTASGAASARVVQFNSGRDFNGIALASASAGASVDIGVKGCFTITGADFVPGATYVQNSLSGRIPIVGTSGTIVGTALATDQILLG